MKNLNKYDISRNEWTYYKRITPNTSNSSDIIPTNIHNCSYNKNKSIRKNLLREEIKTNSVKNRRNIMNFNTDKIVVGNTINNNDIKYIFDNSSNSYFNNFQSIKDNPESNKILENYIIRLKNFGFPEIGEIHLSNDISEQEKTFNFFEYLITKETNNLERNNIKAKENEEQLKKINNLDNKIKQLIEDLNIKEDQILNLIQQIKEQKDFYEQQITELSKENENLISINNKITLKKKNLEFKLHSLNKTFNKFENMKSNIINAVEVIDQAQNKDMAKMLNRVRNSEKLIETLKSEYNESLRDLSFKVSSFRNLIFEIHNEICILLEKPYNIENKIYDLPFLEVINCLKKTFKKNFELLKEKIDLNNFEDLI